jgi:hypothetical protein
MNATLEKELAALSPEEKAEVIDFLLPEVIRQDDEGIPAELLTELERRCDEYDANPTGEMTLKEFDQKWFGKK